MAKAKDYPGFETLGADIKAAQQALGLSRRALAERVNIAPRYLANIEDSGDLPSVPVLYELVKICNLPTERYFHPEAEPEGSEQRQRTSHKLKLCPEHYLPIIEGPLTGPSKWMNSREKKRRVCKHPLFLFPFNALMQLSAESVKQRTTRYAGGGEKAIPKKSPIRYNKGVQAYCTKKGDFNGKTSK